MPPKWMLWAVTVGVFGILLMPDTAYAWTPATHIYLGESVLANLGQLSQDLASLLRAFPYDFLYGNI
ncbi:MAG: zinc dependent phospholipase C family protein, partial [Gemmatimonadota bacterium]|nr:zinc dependent phospholipase C family protein [Gemmatimonadota bacterium]